jgi:hypothetical protein
MIRINWTSRGVLEGVIPLPPYLPPGLAPLWAKQSAAFKGAVSITLAQAKAGKRRQHLIDTAVQRWRKAVKGLGLNGTAFRSGLRAIEASPRPGNAVTNLIREYRGRHVQAIETLPMADPSDAQALKVRLYRQRSNTGWFPSDPQYLLLAPLNRDVGSGLMTLAEFQDRSRQIAAMTMPYPKHLLADEKVGMGSFSQRNAVQTADYPDHMKVSR